MRLSEDQQTFLIKCMSKALVVAGMLVKSGRSQVLVSITRDAVLAERAGQLVFARMVEMRRWGVATPRLVRLLLDEIASLADES